MPKSINRTIAVLLVPLVVWNPLLAHADNSWVQIRSSLTPQSIFSQQALSSRANIISGTVIPKVPNAVREMREVEAISQRQTDLRLSSINWGGPGYVSLSEVALAMANAKPPQGRTPEDPDWEALLRDWDRHYRTLRSHIQQAKTYKEKLAIVEAIHGPIVNEEIERIRSIEMQENQQFGESSYERIEPRSDPWFRGLESVDSPTEDVGRSSRYYYHGTSLGVAVVSATRGFLGGMPGVWKALDIDDLVSTPLPASSLTFLNEIQENQDLFNMLADSARYADRICRPGRAILTYYAMRIAWEQEGIKKRFPPLSYFLQRAILRMPKEDAPTAAGSAFWSSLAIEDPISLTHAQVLLDQDIALPKMPLKDGEGLAHPEDDPENLVNDEEDLEEHPYKRDTLLRARTASLHERISGLAAQKWRPLVEPDIEGTWRPLQEITIHPIVAVKDVGPTKHRDTTIERPVNPILELCNTIANKPHFKENAQIQVVMREIEEKARSLTPEEIDFIVSSPHQVSAAFRTLQGWVELPSFLGIVVNRIMESANLFLLQIGPALNEIRIARQTATPSGLTSQGSSYDALSPWEREYFIDPIDSNRPIREVLASFRLHRITRDQAVMELRKWGIGDIGLIDAYLTHASAPIAMDTTAANISNEFPGQQPSHELIQDLRDLIMASRKHGNTANFREVKFDPQDEDKYEVVDAGEFAAVLRFKHKYSNLVFKIPGYWGRGRADKTVGWNRDQFNAEIKLMQRIMYGLSSPGRLREMELPSLGITLKWITTIEGKEEIPVIGPFAYIRIDGEPIIIEKVLDTENVKIDDFRFLYQKLWELGINWVDALDDFHTKTENAGYFDGHLVVLDKNGLSFTSAPAALTTIRVDRGTTDVRAISEDIAPKPSDARDLAPSLHDQNLEPANPPMSGVLAIALETERGLKTVHYRKPWGITRSNLEDTAEVSLSREELFSIMQSLRDQLNNALMARGLREALDGALSHYIIATGIKVSEFERTFFYTEAESATRENEMPEASWDRIAGFYAAKLVLYDLTGKTARDFLPTEVEIREADTGYQMHLSERVQQLLGLVGATIRVEIRRTPSGQMAARVFISKQPTSKGPNPATLLESSA